MTPGFFTGIGSQANPGSTGNAGTVSVSAGTLSITNSGLISSSTSASGNGGSVTVSVAGGLTIDGAMTPFFTGITSQANPGSTGNAGTVSISAGTLSITNGGEISSSTFGFGNGGDVDVTVADGVTLSGTGPNGAASEITASVYRGEETGGFRSRRQVTKPARSGFIPRCRRSPPSENAPI